MTAFAALVGYGVSVGTTVVVGANVGSAVGGATVGWDEVGSLVVVGPAVGGVVGAMVDGLEVVGADVTLGDGVGTEVVGVSEALGDGVGPRSTSILIESIAMSPSSPSPVIPTKRRQRDVSSESATVAITHSGPWLPLFDHTVLQSSQPLGDTWASSVPMSSPLML